MTDKQYFDAVTVISLANDRVNALVSSNGPTEHLEAAKEILIAAQQHLVDLKDSSTAQDRRRISRLLSMYPPGDTSIRGYVDSTDVPCS